MNKLYFYIGAGVAGIMVLGAIWFLFFAGSGPTTTPTTPGNTFGVGDDRPVTVPITSDTANEPIATDTTGVSTKIFKIVDGPVAGATLLQLDRPTTTVARFVMQDSGHVFDLPLDSPGAITRAVSNTTVPGITSVAWEPQGNGATLQYVENTIKTLHLAFPAATSTLGKQQAVKIQFLPNGIASLAVSPNGKSVVYMLKTVAGSDGYTANVDGTGSKKLFSLPLSQVLVSWPSTNTILVQSNSAAGVAGMVFSVNAQTGATVPLIFATGITATADQTFSKIVYQTTAAGSNAHTTYVRDTKTGLNTTLSFDPYPEKCIWSHIASSTMYCAAPLTYVPANYLDFWHAGTASAADSIFVFNVVRGVSRISATPGSGDGGEQADIDTIALSKDEKYLIYIRKGDRSLWGVRLSQ